MSRVILSVERYGYTNIRELFDQIYLDLLEAGYRSVYRDLDKFTLESTLAVDPNATSQPWRAHFDSSYVLLFQRSLVVGSKAVAETVEEKGRIVFATSAWLPDDGTALPLGYKPPEPPPKVIPLSEYPEVFEIITFPIHGTLQYNQLPNFTYTPEEGYVGTDSFTYRCTRGTVVSNVATVTLNVTPLANPVALDATLDVKFNTPTIGVMKAGSYGNRTLIFDVVDLPTHGNLQVNDANFTYTPHSGYVGTDSFTFIVTYKSHISNLATISLKVKANTVPVVTNLKYTTEYATPISIDLSKGVTHPQEYLQWITYCLTYSPANGILSVNTGAWLDSGALTYTPNAGFSGDDTFKYRVTDQIEDSNEGTVTVTVKPKPAPIISPYTQTITVRRWIPFAFTAEAATNNTLNYSIVRSPKGTLSGSFPNLTYTSEISANFSSSDSFTFKGTDPTNAVGFQDSNIATVNIVIIFVPKAFVLKTDNTPWVGATVKLTTHVNGSAQDYETGDLGTYITDANGEFPIVDGGHSANGQENSVYVKITTPTGIVRKVAYTYDAVMQNQGDLVHYIG